MKIKLMIAAVIACLVFTGFTKENLSDTIDHNGRHPASWSYKMMSLRWPVPTPVLC